jgi:hypothetical protein
MDNKDEIFSRVNSMETSSRTKPTIVTRGVKRRIQECGKERKKGQGGECQLINPCEKHPLGKKLKESLQRRIASWSGRAVGREVGMEKIIDSIGIIGVWRHGDQV